MIIINRDLVFIKGENFQSKWKRKKKYDEI